MRLILRGLGIWAGLIVALVATFAAGSEDKYFDSAGVSIRYIEDGRSEPIVLAHGYTGNIERSWVGPGIIAELAKTHRVIAFDHRGHGKSGKLHDPAQYGPEMGQDIIRLMDHLQLPKAHIMGYSLGANVVAQLVTKNN